MRNCTARAGLGSLRLTRHPSAGTAQINLIRPFLVTALNRFAHHVSVEEEAEGNAIPAAAAAGAAAAGGGAW
jgi:hypothetical protein